MQKAISLAEIALSKDEIPVGAIIVKNEKIVGQGYNQKELLKDPTAHAEIIAITSAASTLNDWRLNGCTMYVTKEPCAMCSGAILIPEFQQLYLVHMTKKRDAVALYTYYAEIHFWKVKLQLKEVLKKNIALCF